METSTNHQVGVSKNCSLRLTIFCEPLPHSLGKRRGRKWLEGRGQERADHNMTENNVIEMENENPNNRKEQGCEETTEGNDTAERRDIDRSREIKQNM